jgi:hypothetical protein
VPVLLTLESGMRRRELITWLSGVVKALEREHEGELNAAGVGPSLTVNGPGMSVTSIHEDET